MRSISIFALVAFTVACGAEPGDPPANPVDSTTGGGGEDPTTQTTTTGGGGAPGTGGGPVEYATEVGAAYQRTGDARVVLVDGTGTRTSLFNPSTGAFESPDDIDELEGGTPLQNVDRVGECGR